MSRLIFTLLITALLVLGAGPALGADPEGQRVERPDEGFAVTFPEDWVVITLDERTLEPILRKLESVDPAFAEVARQDIASVEANEVIKLTAYSRYDEPPSGVCGVASMPSEGMSLVEYVDWDVAAMETTNAEFIVVAPEVRQVRLPAGESIRVEAALRIAGEVGHRTMYYLMHADTVFMLGCNTFQRSDDLWLSIAETFEFLAEEDRLPSGDPLERPVKAVDAVADSLPGGRFGPEIAQGRIERPADGFAITLPSDWDVEEVSASGNEWIDEHAENPQGAAVIRQLIWAGDESLDQQCFVSDASGYAASPPAWTQLDQGVEHEVASMASWSRVDQRGSSYLDLPAGRVGLVEFWYADGSGGQMYIFKRGERWLTLHCEASVQPADDWLAIAESFAFLPPEPE